MAFLGLGWYLLLILWRKCLRMSKKWQIRVFLGIFCRWVGYVVVILGVFLVMYFNVLLFYCVCFCWEWILIVL